MSTPSVSSVSSSSPRTSLLGARWEGGGGVARGGESCKGGGGRGGLEGESGRGGGGDCKVEGGEGSQSGSEG